MADLENSMNKAHPNAGYTVNKNVQNLRREIGSHPAVRADYPGKSATVTLDQGITLRLVTYWRWFSRVFLQASASCMVFRMSVTGMDSSRTALL